MSTVVEAVVIGGREGGVTEHVPEDLNALALSVNVNDRFLAARRSVRAQWSMQFAMMPDGGC